MSINFQCLRGLRNLALSTTLGRVRPNIRQGLVRYCSAQEEEKKLSNIARVAKEYSEAYNNKPTNEKAQEKDRRDRRTPIPVETSIRYLKSEAYKNIYGSEPVWVPYRRNFKGQLPPGRTRLACIIKGILVTNNPCPVCRDKYLVLHYKNVELLKQFISINGAIVSYKITNICQMQHENLLSAVMESKDLGLLTYDVPFRVYNYEIYKPKKEATN